MNRIRIKIFIIVFLALLCLIAILSTWYNKNTVLKEYKQAVVQKDKWDVDTNLLPTPENIFILKNEYDWLLKREAELKQILSKKRIDAVSLTPLQFKEQLLDTQNKIKQLADIQGIKIKGTFGFPEYAGGEIPDAGRVMLLTKQLEVIKESLDIILKYKVEEIASIERMPELYSTEDTKGVLYQEIVFRIEITGTYEQLLGILKDIINAKKILVVRNLKMDKIGENKIDAELLVSGVEF